MVHAITHRSWPPDSGVGSQAWTFVGCLGTCWPLGGGLGLRLSGQRRKGVTAVVAARETGNARPCGAGGKADPADGAPHAAAGVVQAPPNQSTERQGRARASTLGARSAPNPPQCATIGNSQLGHQRHPEIFFAILLKGSEIWFHRMCLYPGRQGQPAVAKKAPLSIPSLLDAVCNLGPSSNAHYAALSIHSNGGGGGNSPLPIHRR